MTFASGYTPDPQHPEYAPYLRSIATRIHQVLAVFPRPGTVRIQWLRQCELSVGSSNYTYSKDEVIVKTPNRAYTSYDAAELVADLGFFGKAASLGYIQVRQDKLFVTHRYLMNRRMTQI